MPPTRALVQTLADRTAALRGGPSRPVPDLGPAVVMDQLAVVIHDLFEADPEANAASSVANELRGIRRGF